MNPILANPGHGKPALAKQTRDPGRAARRRTTRQIADTFLPRYRRAIQFALTAIRERATLGELTALAERGRAFLILQAFGLDKPSMTGARPEHAKAEVLFRQLLERSALENLEAMPSRLRGLGLLKQDAGLELGFSFNAVNPQVIEFLRRHDLAEVRGIDNKTRLGVLAIITKAQTDGLPPAAQARLLKKLVGLTPKQIKMVANFRTLLEGGEKAAVFRSALTRALRDHRFDATLISAIESGVKLPSARVDQMVDRFGERMLAFRANNIARTETIRAANAGQQLLWRQMANQGIFARQDVVRVWIVTPDDRLCPICEPIPGMNPAGVELEQPFVSPVGDIMHPPVHPQCRCDTALDTRE